MPVSSAHQDPARAVVFAPLDATGRAELVAQRLTDAIVGGMLRDGERLPSESELSRSFGVAVVTAREALETMRGRGLVQTRRGRDGGSFVTYDRDTAVRMLDARLRDQSRIQVRDLALHLQAITGTAAAIAADRASADDIDSLQRMHDASDLSTSGGARRAVGRFHLELAAVSQSPRLVREEVRLQGEAGPLLWLCLRDQEYRERSAREREQVLAALRAAAPEPARAAVVELIHDARDWLIDEKQRVEASDRA